MKVILCTHNSGGVGKTTLAVHIAGILAEEGRVLLIDCDEQADAWKFYTGGEEPSPRQDSYTNEEKQIKVIYNPDRLPLKKLASPEQYDYTVLDMDTPLPNIVNVIIGSDPNLVLIPVNISQKSKSLRNLTATLGVIAKLEGRSNLPLEVRIVPLGVSEEEISRFLSTIEEQPTSCEVTEAMENLQDEMQEAIYEIQDYIWNIDSESDGDEYFRSILDSVIEY